MSYSPMTDHDREHATMAFIETFDGMVRTYDYHPVALLDILLEVAQGEAAMQSELLDEGTPLQAWAEEAVGALAGLPEASAQALVRAQAVQGPGARP